MKKNKKIVEDEEERYLDPKKSVLPKWLLDKGVTCHHWDWYEDIGSIKKRLKKEEKMYETFLEFRKNVSKKLNKKEVRFFSKEFGWKFRSFKDEIKELRDSIKRYGIIYFHAADVEKLFRELVNKYELTEKNKIIRPRPQDIGKKRYICVSCGRSFYTRKKPKKCYGRCTSRKFERYYRI